MFKRSYTRSFSQSSKALKAIVNIDGQTIETYNNNNKDLTNVTGQQLTRATKSQRTQFKTSSSSSSSFCEIVIAISTFGGLLTSASTSSTTSSTYIAGPLINLLKLFLAGCYYLAAFASLMMLIIYMNHLGQNYNHLPRNNTTTTKLQQNHLKQVADIQIAAANSNTTHGLHMIKVGGHIRVSRSIPEVGSPSVAVAPEDGQLRQANSSSQPSIINSMPLLAAQFAQPASGVLPNRSFSMPMVMMVERRFSSEQTTSTLFESHKITNTVQQQQQQQNSSSSSSPTGNRVRNYYSANNRGQIPTTIKPQMITSNSTNNNLDQGQWIPIVNTRVLMVSESSPPIIKRQSQLLPSQSQLHNRYHQPPKTISQSKPMATTSVADPNGSGSSLSTEESARHNRFNHRPPRHFDQAQFPSESFNQPHHHNRNYPAPNSFPAAYNRHWRRPRFHPDYDILPRISKMYKVVLLCDKTLVSLDYIKRIHFEPPSFNDHHHHQHHRHHHHHHHNHPDDSDENDIDLDFNLDPIFAASRRHATISGNISSPSLSPSSTEIIIDKSDPTNNGDGSGNDKHDSKMDADDDDTLEKRSFLTEEDPLVRCDMWDLEKGLKNRKPPREILQMAVRADFDTVRDAINRCRQLSEKMLPPDDEYRDGIEIMSTEDLISLFSIKRGLIPGTKWCGLGDIASNYNDLGPKHRIDICCRAHDHCPIRLKPFRNDYGVLNIALYTKSHCDCDADFYRCLREVHSRTADMLGNLYFNVMKLQCMREERMKICREMRPIALGFERCVRYEESPMKTVFKFTTPPVAY